MYARFCLWTPRLESLFSPVLWKSYNQILLAFKVRFPGDLQSLCQISRLGSLTWSSEPSQQCKNFFAITVLQFVGHPSSRYGIWFYCDWTLPTFLLWLLLCLWTWGIFFWWVPASSCWTRCSTASCDFGALTEVDEHTSYSTILNQKPLSKLFHSLLSASSRGSLALQFLPLRVVSSACLKLIFLSVTLISPCDSLSPAFHMYSAYKLNKQGNNMYINAFPSQVWTRPILTVPCLTVHCWPAYMFLRAGKVVWYSHLLNNFPQLVVIHTKALASSVREKYTFSWNSLAFSMIQQMLAMWSLVPLPFLNTACTPGNSLKPSLKDFEPY